jgi:hypothetical protein
MPIMSTFNEVSFKLGTFDMDFFTDIPAFRLTFDLVRFALLC